MTSSITMISVAPRSLRALVAGVLVPLMVLLVTLTPRSAHACGGDAGMTGCSCTVADAQMPQLRRPSCCEPEPEARATPPAVMTDAEAVAPLTMRAPIGTPSPSPAPSPVAVPIAWPRGPPDPGPLYLRHCSLLR